MAFHHLDPKRARRRIRPSRLFKYEPLKLPRHIRLLKINNPDLLGSKIWPDMKPPRLPYYEMVQVPLDSLPEYTALSYAWGHPNKTWVLNISGASLAITASLAEAMRALPRIASSEYLWLDQVCINQADEKEKNRQVQIMGEIYSNSHKVSIWTGGEIKGLRLALDTYLPLTRSKMLEFSMPDSAYTRPVAVDVDLHLRNPNPATFEPLRELLLRPWFQRAWVVQEAVLGNTTAIVAGSCQLSIEELAWATDCRVMFDRPARSSVARFCDSIRSKIVLDTMFALRHPTLSSSLGLVSLAQDSGFDSLIMDSLATNRASDPRDHVYAFLGFQNDPNISIVPDYSLSVTETFTRAANAMIKGTKSLELLRFLPNNPYDTRLSYDDHTGLPSWVPDWSFRRQEGRIFRTGCHRDGPTLPFDASKGTSHRPNLLARMEESELVVSGRIIDSIASMLSSAERLELVEDRPRFFGLSDEEVTALDATALSDPAQKLRKRLVVMFVGGCIRVAPTVEEVLKRYDEGQPPPEDLDDPMRWFIGRRQDLIKYDPVRTQKSKLGFVRRKACVGDLVVILHGFQVPMVLRPTEGGAHIVVGQCYIEDAMYGEAMTWKEDEADEFTLV